MNKRGEVGPIGAIILFIVFLINWFVWFGAWLGNLGEIIILENNLVGLEAFFYANLNLVVWICMLLGMLAWGYFSSE